MQLLPCEALWDSRIWALKGLEWSKWLLALVKGAAAVPFLLLLSEEGWLEVLVVVVGNVKLWMLPGVLGVVSF